MDPFNPQVPVQYQALKPEHVTDVEIGVKKDWDLAGAHFRTNADVYHTDYKSIQIPQNISVPNAQGNISSQSIYTNAASAFGPRRSGPGTMPPRSAKRFCTAGSLNTNGYASG